MHLIQFINRFSRKTEIQLELAIVLKISWEGYLIYYLRQYICYKCKRATPLACELLARGNRGSTWKHIGGGPLT